MLIGAFCTGRRHSIEPSTDKFDFLITLGTKKYAGFMNKFAREL